MKTTARSLQWLKKESFAAALVERRLPKTFTTVDAFGVIDILVMDPHDGCLGVQACGPDVAVHKAKIEAEPRAAMWLRRRNRLEIFSWRKLKVKRGGVAIRWTLRRISASLGEAGAIVWTEAEEAP